MGLDGSRPEVASQALTTNPLMGKLLACTFIKSKPTTHHAAGKLLDAPQCLALSQSSRPILFAGGVWSILGGLNPSYQRLLR